jgi:hypothetical protein
MNGRFAPEAANRNRMLWMSAFHPDSDIAHLRSHVGCLPTADMPSLPNVVMPTNRKPPRSGFSH